MNSDRTITFGGGFLAEFYQEPVDPSFKSEVIPYKLKLFSPHSLATEGTIEADVTPLIQTPSPTLLDLIQHALAQKYPTQRQNQTVNDLREVLEVTKGGIDKLDPQKRTYLRIQAYSLNDGAFTLRKFESGCLPDDASKTALLARGLASGGTPPYFEPITKDGRLEYRCLAVQCYEGRTVGTSHD